MMKQFLFSLSLLGCVSVSVTGFGATQFLRENDVITYSIDSITNRGTASRDLKFQFAVCVNKKSDNSGRCYPLTSVSRTFPVLGKPDGEDEYVSRPNFVSSESSGGRVNQAIESAFKYLNVQNPADVIVSFAIVFGVPDDDTGKLDMKLVTTGKAPLPSMDAAEPAPIPLSIKTADGKQEASCTVSVSRR